MVQSKDTTLRQRGSRVQMRKWGPSPRVNRSRRRPEYTSDRLRGKAVTRMLEGRRETAEKRALMLESIWGGL